jgi:hypothetical protein
MLKPKTQVEQKAIEPQSELPLLLQESARKTRPRLIQQSDLKYIGVRYWVGSFLSAGEEMPRRTAVGK